VAADTWIVSVSRAPIAALAVFAMCVAGGTWLDMRAPRRAAAQSAILSADLHIHPYPGDGSLPVWELQHEAGRRSLDVIAITGHNNRFGLEVGRLHTPDAGGPIVIPGQEVTTQAFHLVALGITDLIDWRLTARDAIAAIHAQGGVAIAAHPIEASWRDHDVEALRMLDGAEVAHQSHRQVSLSRDEFLEFFNRARSVNPAIAPIGSSDFHMVAPLGMCRTYLLVRERSTAGVLDAIRDGRTVAQDGRGVLFGSAEHVAAVEEFLSHTPLPSVSDAERMVALFAMLALAAVVLLR
jgi:hypothetical protein